MEVLYLSAQDLTAVWAMAWLRLNAGFVVVAGTDERELLSSICRVGAERGLYWEVASRGGAAALLVRWEQSETAILTSALGVSSTPLRARSVDHERALRVGLRRAVWCARSHCAEQERLMLDAAAESVTIPILSGN